MSVESVMLFNHLILCHLLLLLPSIFPSIRVFSNESAFHIGWPKYWSFSFSISASNEYSGLISLRIHWYSCNPRDSRESSPALQFESINSLTLSLLYGPTLTSVHDYWKNHSFDLWTFVSKMISLIFNLLSRFVITFLPRSNRLLISWLQSLSLVILEPKICHCFYCPLFNLPWSDGTCCHDLSFIFFLMLSFKPPFSLSSFTLIKGLFNFCH